MKLVVEDLHTGYSTDTVVNGVDLTLEDGDSIAVIGRNGMGKTTLVRAILGYLPRTRGRVIMGSHLVSGWATHRIVRLGIGYAPQDNNLFSELSVAQNLDAGWAHTSVDRRHREQVLGQLFPVLGQRLRQRAGTLSGGEQRMLVLARALLMRPSLLILDEISEGLQPGMITKVQGVLRAGLDGGDLTLLMVEQNLDLSLSICNRLAVMKLGKLAYHASSSDAGVRGQLVTQLAPSAS
jgi:ABC-type branched-subunit amino acid transport system ATPase component